MAQRFRAGISEVVGVEVTQATQSNGVFAILPPGAADLVRESFRFYDWDQARGEVRWMCSWDTTQAAVDSLVEAVRRAIPPAGSWPIGCRGTP